MPSIAFSCVVDDHDLFRIQSFVWLNCLIHLQKVNPADIYVHIIGGPDGYRRWLESEGVNVVAVRVFDQRNLFCNKLQQLDTFCCVRHDHVVLMDCDTAWIGRHQLPVSPQVSAKIVDYAKPPEAILERIFAVAGMGQPQWRQANFARGPGRTLTDVNNCNGGVYICASGFLNLLAPAWRRWANWCINNAALFEGATKHADQVSFALAMRELGACLRHLGIEWNYPAHLTNEALPDITPEIIHYHRQLEDGHTLRTTGVPSVDRAIASLNGHMAGFMRPSGELIASWRGLADARLE